jgi:hypothetical protein
MATRRKQDVFERLLQQRQAASPQSDEALDAHGVVVKRGAIVNLLGVGGYRAQSAAGTPGPAQHRGIVERVGWADLHAHGGPTASARVAWPSDRSLVITGGLSAFARRRHLAEHCYYDQHPVERLVVIGQAHAVPRCNRSWGTGWERPKTVATTPMAKWAGEAKRLRDRMRPGAATDDPATRALLEARAVQLDAMMERYRAVKDPVSASRLSRRLSDDSITRTIRSAAARMFFVMAWASREEEAGRDRNWPPRANLDSLAPTTSAAALRHATHWLLQLQVANGAQVRELLYRAHEADANGRTYPADLGARARDQPLNRWVDENAESFGEQLAMQGVGTGSSWFDDHAQFELKIPNTEFHI